MSANMETCNRSGCQRPRYKEGEITHSYCGKTCAQLVTKYAETMSQLITPFASMQIQAKFCSREGCTKLCWKDPVSDFQYEHCGRTCAKLNAKPQISRLKEFSSAYNKVKQAFQRTMPSINSIVIYELKASKPVQDKYSKYKEDIKLTPCKRFHGTAFHCGLDILQAKDKISPCSISTCSVCGIINHGFLLSISPGGSVYFLIIGIYSALSASTAHNYTRKGVFQGWCAMFYCDVLDRNVHTEAIGIRIEQVIW
jgi:hypothetical protein